MGHGGNEGGFTFTGEASFAGEVDGCGSGTVYFDVSGEGVRDEGGTNAYTTNTYTIIPGGTLSVTGTLVESGVEVRNGDGTATVDYTGTITCEASAETAE